MYSAVTSLTSRRETLERERVALPKSHTFATLLHINCHIFLQQRHSMSSPLCVIHNTVDLCEYFTLNCRHKSLILNKHNH